MRHLSLVVLVALLVFVGAGSGQASSLSVSDLREQLNQAFQEEEQVARELTATEESLAKVRRQIGQYEQDYQQHEQLLRTVEDELQQVNEQLGAVEKQLARLDSELYAEGSALQARETELADIYSQMAQEKPSFWTRLTSSGSLSGLLRRLDFLDYRFFLAGKAYARVSEANEALISSRSQTAIRQEELTKRAGELATRVSQISGEQRRRAEAMAASRQQRAKLENELTIRRQRYQELTERTASFEQQLQATLGEVDFPWQKGESVGWPLAEKGRITSDYGDRNHPILNEVRFHTGVDIAAPAGSPIRAIADGTVTVAESLGGYGLAVIVDHGGGFSSLYAHASRLLVRPGQQVAKGQTIALVGSTGLSTGPHLHLEIREDNTHRNPWIWL